MQSFITETLQQLLKTQKSFENTVFVLPSQRAGVFLKKALQEKIEFGFLPEILNIENFIQLVSGMQKIDAVPLLFHFYSCYKKATPKPESFDLFASWAATAVQDFNEIDQHLIDPLKIFNYLKDIHRIKEWDLKTPLEQTQMMKNHFSFMEKLGDYYTAFYSYLLEKKWGYQGLIYREATKNMESYKLQNKHKEFIFLGFNALNKAEEVLFQYFLEQGNTQVFWDIDAAFLKSKHQAGQFIRKYKAEWTYYQKNELQTVSAFFNQEKNIQIIGTSKNTTQAKHIGEILANFSSFNNTALVLADENLLPIVLNSLPKNVESANITMGYPLKNIPTTALFTTLFNLFLTQEKLQKSEQNLFYYKEVLAFLKHPLLQQILANNNGNLATKITAEIAKKNETFITTHRLNELFGAVDGPTKKILLQLFNRFVDTAEFIERILALISQLKTVTSQLDTEYLFRFYTIFKQLQNLQSEFNYLQELKTLQQLFLQLIRLENLSFQGEPLQGLQIMGMLETRGLDFENVVISSVNETVLPANSSQNSFIPFDVKIEFGLPTYKEKDAVFSYHFFRLLQRAKNVFLLFNSENDSLGGGEKSRFITQLMQLKPGIKIGQISPKVITEKPVLKTAEKTSSVLIKLEELAAKGISPSTLTTYLRNPYDFYKQKILGIKELKKVEEIVAANTMGTIIHKVLEALYKPYIGQYLTEKNLADMLPKIDDLVPRFFEEIFYSSGELTGKNRLIFEISKKFVLRFINDEKKLVAAGNQLKILTTEQRLETLIHVKGISFPIKIHGEVDRIDQLNGVIRIIDYKTGKVASTNLKVGSFDSLTEDKHHKAIQVLLYAFLYSKSIDFKADQAFEAGVISFKNLNSGFLKVNFSDKKFGKDTLITQEKLDEFIVKLNSILLEIYNKEMLFEEKAV